MNKKVYVVLKRKWSGEGGTSVHGVYTSAEEAEDVIIKGTSYYRGEFIFKIVACNPEQKQLDGSNVEMAFKHGGKGRVE